MRSRRRAPCALAALLAAGCASVRAPAVAGAPAPAPAPAERRAAPPPAEPGARRAPAATRAEAAAGDLPGPRCPPGMALVPGGRLQRAGRAAAVAAFCLDRTEVTMAEHARCVARGACQPPAESGAWAGITADLREASARQCNQGKPGRERHPVNCVTAEQAARYCAWRGARLPVEDEWVWAARGGSRGWRFPWGDAEPGGRACWSGAPGAGAQRDAGTCPVGSHPAGDSPLGLHDLAGNVSEWVSTAEGGHVARGGAFIDLRPIDLEAEGGRWSPAPERSGAVGFRCARPPDRGAAPPG